jgi:hypothetical protein
MSGKYKMGDAAIFTISTTCDGQVRHFKTEKSIKLWKKLHYKKCEICRHSEEIMTFTNTDIHHGDGTTMNSHLNKKYNV